MSTLHELSSKVDKLDIEHTFARLKYERSKNLVRRLLDSSNSSRLSSARIRRVWCARNELYKRMTVAHDKYHQALSEWQEEDFSKFLDEMHEKHEGAS